jgi:4-hydroxythreonine-4-phosphate dehydrogenase
MFLVTEDLKVAVSTHHIPIAQVAENISKEKIKKQIRVLNQTLIEDFNITRPKIAVLGLNPHAGDGGVIGKEEIEIIAPAIKELSDNGVLAFGPFPADSFSSRKIQKFRCCFSHVSRSGTGSFQNSGL